MKAGFGGVGLKWPVCIVWFIIVVQQDQEWLAVVIGVGILWNEVEGGDQVLGLQLGEEMSPDQSWWEQRWVEGFFLGKCR